MLKFFLSFALISLLALSLGSAQLHAEMKDKAHQIKHFARVDLNLYRGGQPTRADLIALKELGVKKIINFRNEEKLIEEERALVEELGLEYVSIPWLIFAPYDHTVFTRFFAEIKDKDSAPVFFHCKRGSERTGAAAAIYKITHKGFSVENAFSDACRFNVLFYWKPFVKNIITEYHTLTHEKP
jgi:protein tyrosine phosphatase (PTP) superfamily phosphohydrolase (DUF442 family)